MGCGTSNNFSLFDLFDQGNMTLLLKIINNKPQYTSLINENNQTILIKLTINRCENIALKILNTGYSKPDHIDNEGNTALIYACRNKMNELANEIIDKYKCDIYQINKSGINALYWAGYNNLYDVVRKIINYNCNNKHIYLTSTNFLGYTPLMSLCKVNDYNANREIIIMEFIDILLTCDNNKIKYVNNYDQSAFSLACESQLENVIIKMIDLDLVDLEYKNKYDETVLMIVCNNKLENIAMKLIDKLLINKKHIINFINKQKISAFTISCSKKLYKVADKILQVNQFDYNIKKFDYSKYLFIACSFGCEKIALKIIDIMLFHNISLECLNDWGDNLLIVSCREKLEYIAYKLIKLCPQSVNIISNYNKTPLIYACENKMSIIANKIIKIVYNSYPHLIYQQNKMGETALIIACKNKMFDTINYILSLNINKKFIGFVDNYNYTALFYTCENKLDIIALNLINSNHSNPSHIKNGKTSLMLCCSNNMVNVAISLLRTGKSKHKFMNSQGKDAMYYAIKNNLSSIFIKIFKNIYNLNDILSINNKINSILLSDSRFITLRSIINFVNTTKPNHHYKYLLYHDVLKDICLILFPSHLIL